MTADQIASSIWYLGALVLVGSALVVRPLPKRKFLVFALAWVAIIFVLWLIVRAVGGASA